MSLSSPAELMRFLQEVGASPAKGLSQNFLIDGNITRKIASLADVHEGDLVLEIGPGPGALTQELLARGARVTAVEMDATFAKALQRLQTSDQRLQVIQGDFLELPLELLQWKEKKGKVVANLPYHLTSPILAKVVPRQDLFTQVVVMVQDEVARRCTSPPGSRLYGSFTLFLQLFSQVTYGHKVSRRCFYPVPKVDSAVLCCALRPPPPVDNLAGFQRFFRLAFEQRRKMLRSSLRALFSSEEVTSALETLGLNPKARPEDLGLEAFLNLWAHLNLE